MQQVCFERQMHQNTTYRVCFCTSGLHSRLSTACVRSGLSQEKLSIKVQPRGCVSLLLLEGARIRAEAGATEAVCFQEASRQNLTNISLTFTCPESVFQTWEEGLLISGKKSCVFVRP